MFRFAASSALDSLASNLIRMTKQHKKSMNNILRVLSLTFRLSACQTAVQLRFLHLFLVCISLSAVSLRAFAELKLKRDLAKASE